MTLQAKKLDRRRFERFAIERDLIFTFLGQNRGEIVIGKTINMSSKGILFKTDHMLLPGDGLAILINWPERQNQKPVELFAQGRIIGRHSGAVSLEIHRAEFRDIPM